MPLYEAVSNLSEADLVVIRHGNGSPSPTWVSWWWMIASTQGGGRGFCAFCGIALLASHDPGKLAAFLAATIAAATGILLFTVVKKAVGRRRPCTLEPHCWATLLR